MRSARLTLAQALDLYDRFQEIPVKSKSPSSLSRFALVLADRYHLPAVCDAHYVALAELLGFELWTDDQRLLRALGHKLPLVRWIGDYQPPKP